MHPLVGKYPAIPSHAVVMGSVGTASTGDTADLWFPVGDYSFPSPTQYGEG